MKLKVGDVVEFKKYEDMTKDEKTFIPEEAFPKHGKISEIINDNFFFIEDYGYTFNQKSVARVISDAKCFIVQEYKYALYIGESGDLVSDKDRAKIYASRVDANADASYMCLSRWYVIKYDN